mmetsp:Transcript_16114/g.50492  ORF Transcript_16114/g.50492 Transcript_16114/m.50492 type:complete len:433 (+) Transcript_16114:94-1392(+)
MLPARVVRRPLLLAFFVIVERFGELRPSQGVTLTYHNKQLLHMARVDFPPPPATQRQRGRPSPEDDDNGTAVKEQLLAQLETIRATRAETQSTFAAGGRPVGSKPRMGICTTGQMGRFELTSKMENLIAINLERYVIDVVLVLAPTMKTRFSNPQTDPGGRRQWSAESIRSHILRRFRTHRNDMQIVVDDSAQQERPYVNQEYKAISKKANLGGSRVESHVRQWLALVRCWQHFSNLERHGPAYDVFVKVRDDSFVLKWWPIKESDYKNRVVISECLGFGGYNDKVAVVDAMYAETYFTRPIYEYYFHYATLRLSRGTPESLLRAVLSKYLVKVKRAKVDSMPIFTNRLERTSNTSVCFVFDSFKLGRNPACWPKSCLLRQQLFCAKCPLINPLAINLTDYFGSSHSREECHDPNEAACKLLRRRLRRHQTH